MKNLQAAEGRAAGGVQLPTAGLLYVAANGQGQAQRFWFVDNKVADFATPDDWDVILCGIPEFCRDCVFSGKCPHASCMACMLSCRVQEHGCLHRALQQAQHSTAAEAVKARLSGQASASQGPQALLVKLSGAKGASSSAPSPCI